jgi:HSP20 family protein
MSLVKKVTADFDWPAWMAGRSILDFPESWIDSKGEAAIRVEEFEDKGELIVRAEAPGVNPEVDIEVTITEGMLRIMIQREKESRHEGARHYRSEFQYGSFVRTLALPAGATDKDVKARYVDGVLEVRIPMNGKHAESKKVTVTRH